MRIVSENSEAEVTRKRALDEIDWPLRDLTANLLRITRGAGNPFYLVNQLNDLIEALRRYVQTVGHFPSSAELGSLLSATRPKEVMERVSDEHLDEVYAEQRIIRGALQVAASRLLGQKAQESAGSHEMFEGMRALDRVQEERNRKGQLERAAKQAALKAEKRKKPGSKKPGSEIIL